MELTESIHSLRAFHLLMIVDISLKYCLQLKKVGNMRKNGLVRKREKKEKSFNKFLRLFS